jgi:heptosyltransferase-2
MRNVREPARFIAEIMNLRDRPAKYDLLIHLGANAKNRSWPPEHFAETVRLLPEVERVAVVGLPGEVDPLRALMPKGRHVEFLVGSLKDALSAIASTRLLLSMDSGNVHFAEALNVSTVAIFGKSDPRNIIGESRVVRAVYEKKFPCQPCGQAECTQPEVYCMNSVMPQTVAEVLREHMGGGLVTIGSSVQTYVPA